MVSDQRARIVLIVLALVDGLFALDMLIVLALIFNIIVDFFFNAIAGVALALPRARRGRAVAAPRALVRGAAPAVAAAAAPGDGRRATSAPPRRRP